MEFWQGLEEPRSDRIYSSGNQGVKKGPGPRGTRDEEFLVPSLFQGQFSMQKIIRSFLIFSHQNIILDLLLTFLITLILEALCFLK